MLKNDDRFLYLLVCLPGTFLVSHFYKHRGWRWSSAPSGLLSTGRRSAKAVALGGAGPAALSSA